jgi:hypothetical protein
VVRRYDPKGIYGDFNGMACLSYAGVYIGFRTMSSVSYHGRDIDTDGVMQTEIAFSRDLRH